MKPKQFNELLTVELTDDEIRKYSLQLAKTCGEKTAKEEEKAKIAERINSELKLLRQSIDELSIKVETGKEDRLVECEERPMYDIGAVWIVRLDTLEKVRERPMNAEDRQGRMFEDETGGLRNEFLEDRDAAVRQAEAEAEANGETRISVHKANAREFFDEDEELRNVLALVTDAVPLDAIENWTPEQKTQAWEWAIAAHNRASDNDACVPPMPEFLKAVESSDGGTPFPTEYSQERLNSFAEYYCLDKLDKNRPVKICYVNDAPMIVLGVTYGHYPAYGEKADAQSVEAYHVLPFANAGEPKQLIGHIGRKFRSGRETWVIVGPKVDLTVENSTERPASEIEATVDVETRESSFQEASQADVNLMAEYYAAVQIGEEKPVRICHIDGKPHVITGAMGSGDARNWQSVDAWPILPLERVGEENAKTYKQAAAEYNSQFDDDDHDYRPLSYKGVKVNCGSKKRPDWWVMVGPETVFKVGAAAVRSGDRTEAATDAEIEKPIDYSADDWMEQAIKKLIRRVKEKPGAFGYVLIGEGFTKGTLAEAESRGLIENIDGRYWYVWTTSDVIAAISTSGPLTRSELHGLGCQLHIITQAEMEGLIQISGDRFLLKSKDDFTAPICDECRRIDGAHTRECSKSGALTYEEYLAYALAHYKSNHMSHARKMDMRRDPEIDAKVRDWQQQQAAGNGGKPEPKAKKRTKLSPVEAAIDR